jgi:hypothetical protein
MPSELHASGCVLRIKRVRIFDEKVGVQQFVRTMSAAEPCVRLKCATTFVPGLGNDLEKGGGARLPHTPHVRCAWTAQNMRSWEAGGALGSS